MTAYVYRAVCPIPAPLGSGGHTATTVWGAGVLAVTYAIRIISVIPANNQIPLWRVDNAVMHNSSIGPTNTPLPSRQGSLACSATTALGSIMTNLSGSTYSYTISGTIPGGTFNYLGNAPTQSAPFTFPSDVIIRPGACFWIGSDITALNVTQGGVATTYFNGSAVGTYNINATSPLQQYGGASQVYFEELHLARSN
jgi:hypothetical protein